MKRYIKRTLIGMAVFLFIVIGALWAAVYFSEDWQKRKVRGTVTFIGPADSAPGALAADDPTNPIRGPLASFFGSRVIQVEICNKSLYQVDYTKWQVYGHLRGRSTRYNLLVEIRGLDAKEKRERFRRVIEGSLAFRSDSILARGECYTHRRAGSFTTYDSLEVVTTDVRFSGAPW